MKKIVLLFTLILSLNAKAAVFNIANGDVAGLIAAINTANSNSEADIINLATNGTYTLTAINFTSTSPNTTGNASQRGLPRILDNVVGLDVIINANGSTIIRDNVAPNFGIFAIAGQTVINDLTVRNGNVNAQGAGIFVEFKGNTEVNNCKFYDNTSTLDAEGGGGAIYTKSLSILRVTNCYFENNKAVNQGGAISNLLSNLYITNSTFKSNSTTDLTGADPCGGAIYDDGARGDNGELVIRGCTFEGNSSNGQGQGGAMFLFPYNSQSVEVTGCTFKTNSAKQGGAFWHKGGGSSGIPDPEYPLSAAAENTTLLFNTCVFDGNISIAGSGGMGGALWISDCKVNEIHSCTFKNNTADLGGAMALLTNRAFTLRNSTFNNNTANQAGAIFAGGITAKLTVQNCTFAANIANQYGGAMSVPQNATPVDIINCTFANNQANNAGNGQSGAIHSGTNAANNTVTIKNNIFTNNTVTNPWNSWRDCNCILNDGGNNIFFPAGVTNNCVTTPNFVNPLVGTLSDNGGLTQTIPILAGSPAINAGVAAPTTDQRGAARVGAADIGAFEFGATACNLVVSSNADAGANTLREAISCATSGQTITFAPSMANQTITLASTLEIPVNKNLTIDGLAAANLTISGNNAVRVFLLKSTSVQSTTLNLKNLKIINGFHTEYGGGVRSEHQGIMNIENCIFNNNNAQEGGSAIFSHFEGKTTIKNCKFDTNVSVAKNSERGSTVMLWGPFAHTIQNSDFTNNRGINGAAINGLNAALLIEDCNFLNNRTTDAFFHTGQPNDFLRGYGGAIYTDRATAGPPNTALGSIIIRRCKFDGNIAQSDGGAMNLYTDETDNVLIEECYFNNNESKVLTGGTNGGSGGAIVQMNNAKNKGFIVRNSTFSNNKAAVNAGAIRADWADTQITNCTFDNNRALLTSTSGFSANGGALAFFSMGGSTVDITNNTFANNYAGWVGGAIAGPTSVRIKNNIFFQNTAGNGGNTWNISHHASNNFTDLGNNLQFPNKFTSNFNDYNVSTTVTIANPLLNAIADNGGFSPTMSLQATSPAINAGAGCPTTDQRGNARVGICDIGAFEFGGAVTPTITISPSALTGFSTIVGTASTAQTYNLKGSNLTTDITATAPTDYEVSLNGTTFANSVTATIANVQAVAGQTISVRIKASALVGSPAGDVTNASTGATTKNVALTGSVTPVPTSPEIQVLEATTDIPDNTGTLVFGSTPVGTPIVKTFTIKNTGTANLTVSALTLPSGFALVGAFPSSIAAGTETTFQVRLTAALQGSFSGALSFTNNDADENPFNFTVSGTVTLAPTALAAVIATGTPKFSCGMTEAAIIAAGATKLTFGGSNYYIGTRQTTAINQDPVIAKFTGGVQDWCNQAYETTGTDGRGNGLFWSGTDLYAIFSADGTQGTVAEDYRRFTTSGWLKTFSDASPGGGGGPKVAILVKINPTTGDGIVGNGTFITALNSSTNKTNSLAIKDVYLDGSGNVVVRADSWFAPRKVNKTAMVQTGTGGSPHDYTLVFNSSLTTALCASAVGWDNGTGTDCSGAIIPAPTVPEIQVLEGLNDVADNTGSINFGTTVVGTPIFKTFTIKNLGTATLTLTAPTLPTGFSLVGVFPTSIAASADATFQVSLTATAAASPSGQISFANNDSNENPFNFALNGTVTATAAPEIQVLEVATDIPDNTGNINFGTTLTSTPITKTFTIKNLGTSILTLGALSPLPTGFSLVGAFPTTLAANASTTFQIRLDAATENVFTGSLSFVNDDADENPFNFTISGTVTNTPTPDIQILDGANDITNTASTLNFGTTVVNTDIIKTFTIKNTGTGTLTLGTLNLPAGFGLIGTFPTSIAAGTSATFQIYLDADAINSASGTLSFTNNSTTKSSFSLTLAGTVTPIVVIPPTPPITPTPVTPPVYIAPPINVMVGQVTENQINFTWNTLPNVTQYAIERRLVGQANFETVKTVSNNSFTDDSVLPAEYYEYRIVALSATPQMSAIFAISTVPMAPTATEAFVCGAGSTILVAQANTTKTVSYKWYEKENDTNGLPSNALQNTEANTFVTPQIQKNTTFYVSTVFNGKESKKTAVNVSVKPLPSAKIREGNGMSSNTISFCEKGVLNAEKVEGASYRWLLNEQEISKGESVEIRFTGTYQLAVSQNGCEKISDPISVVINSLPIAQILQGEKVKFCRKGLIQAQVFSGVTYEWADEKGKVIGNEPILNLIQSGIYTLKTKQNGCESKPAQIKVEIPSVISAPKITANKTTICEGETLKMEVPQTEGATYHWQGAGLFAQTRTIEITYNKYLQNAVYQIYIIKDGCESDVANIEIKFSQPISFELKTQNPNCFGSKDGIIEMLTTNEKLQFKINNQSVSNQLKINNLGKGEYTITAKNEWGCEQSQKVILTDPADFQVITRGNVVTSRFVTAQLNATGAVRYEWSPSVGLDNPNSPNPKANPLGTTVYTVKGYNENGCVRSSELIVTILETESLITNKVLSPNNDGINDVWEIQEIDKFPQNKLVIYNRWGQKVYEAQDYQNNWNGSNVGDGTYYYILFLPENKQLKGVITVVR